MQKEGNLKDLVDRLAKAKMINLDLPLKDIVELADKSSASASLDGEDWFCGTIRRRWFYVKPHDTPVLQGEQEAQPG